MDRDPNSLTDDVSDFDAAIAALDPIHFWKMNETSGDLADSGYGNITLQDTGSPTYAAETGLTGLTGVQFNSGSFFTPATALPASTTTFTILALLKPLHDYIDPAGAILFDHSAATGFYYSPPNLGLRLATATGADASSDLDGGVTLRGTAQLIGIVSDGAAATFYRNGIAYAGGDGTDDTIDTFTPTRVGATAAGANRLRAVLSRLVYMPGVALTTEQIATIWSARFACHTATLAVANRALSHIGESKAVTSLKAVADGGDATVAGVSLRLHLPTAIESILTDYTWPFATRYADLDVVGGTTTTAVNSDWQYSYRAPDRMLRVIRIVKPGQKRAYDSTPPAFKLGQDAVGTLIFTDEPDAELEYVIRPTCPALQGGVHFREALSWYTAALLVPTIGKNEKTQADCYQMAGMYFARATGTEANQEEPQDRNQNGPDWITGR